MLSVMVPSRPNRQVFLALDLVASVVALIGLLPIAGGLPSIAAPAIPFGNAIFFTAILGGALLLLASGPKMVIPTTFSRWYVLVYTALVAAMGAARLLWTGFPNLVAGWLVMAGCIGGLLLILRRFWIWAVVGGIWNSLLLGTFSYFEILSYLSTPTQQFSYLLPVHLFGCVFAALVGFLNLRFRRYATNQVTATPTTR